MTSPWNADALHGEEFLFFKRKEKREKRKVKRKGRKKSPPAWRLPPGV